MGLSKGTRLGPYEIVSLLGAGGMGEVYRARDTRLDRSVAIKVLHSELIATPELKARFDREARAISHLNHPHICTVHDVGRDERTSTDYLVMEFIDGESLADRLAKGPLPIDQAVKIGIEIADALDKAHRSGIVHRDLKPGNIMLTKSGAKLMDFGLAKTATASAMAAGVGPRSPSTATVTANASPLTQHGAIVGTVQYMAPETLEGHEADARSDIFALGTVLYEMVTGQRAFDGKSQMQVVAAILQQEPKAIGELRPESPLALNYIVATCMAKNPEERFQAAHDIQLQLRFVGDTRSQILPSSKPETKVGSKLLAIALSVAVVALATLMIWNWHSNPTSSARPILAYVPAPIDTRLLSFGFGAGPAVVSPDGSRIAFSAISKDGTIRLWLRPLGSHEATPVSGTDDAAAPFWSPDGSSLAFFAGSKLKTVNLVTGDVTTLCDAPAASGSWSSQGTILLPGVFGKPFLKVSVTGGQPTSVAPLSSATKYENHPFFLPDGDHFLYEAGDDSGSRVEMASLSSDSRTTLLADAHSPSYTAGYLLFLRGSKLFAQPFSPSSGTLSGTAVALTGAATYSAVASVLTFQSALHDGRLQWFDINGDTQGVVGAVAFYLCPRISPDGKRILAVAVSPGEKSSDLITLPFSGGASTGLTEGPTWKKWSVWSPDGKYVAYSSSGEHGAVLVRRPADGSGTEEELLKIPADVVQSSVVDWSPDGRYLSYDTFSTTSKRFENWILPLFGDRKPFQVAAVSVSQFDGLFSPDGHWLAYFSNETGTPEVYVVAFPGPGGKYRISNGGGWLVRWAKGNRLFFLTIGNRLMEADLDLTPHSLQIKSIRPLFQVPLLDYPSPLFDVAPDAKRIIGVTPASAEANSIGVLTNWQTLARGK